MCGLYKALFKDAWEEEIREKMKEFCVTGGTGLIGGYLIKALLEKGYRVRATVRDPGNLEKVGYLWEFHGAKERLKLLKADLNDEGSFDEAVHGVEGVFHTGSPVLVPYDDNIQESLIDPCIKGTINVLMACSRSKSVKRVVLTSSCLAIRYRADVQRVSPLSESHWSDPDYCKQHNLWYGYAKTMAEQEAWRVASEQGLDLVVVNPAFVVGPLVSPQPTSTLFIVLAVLKGSYSGEYPNTTVGFVHADDVAKCHLAAMEETRARGRLICSSCVLHWSDIVAMLKEKYPQYTIAHKCSEQGSDNQPHSMDTSKAHSLGISSFKTVEQMFDDCITSFQKKGII